MTTTTTLNPWREALDQALQELAAAEEAFLWADADFCDYHIFRMQAAEEKVALILRQARLAHGLDNTPRLGGTRWGQRLAIAPSESEELENAGEFAP